MNLSPINPDFWVYNGNVAVRKLPYDRECFPRTVIGDCSDRFDLK